MKNVVLSLLVLVFISSCKDAPTTGFTLNGEAKGVFNGVRVYLNETLLDVPAKQNLKHRNEKSSISFLFTSHYLLIIMVNCGWNTACQHIKVTGTLAHRHNSSFIQL